MPIDYSKFDHLEDSDDEDSKAEPQGRILPSNDAALASGQRAQATVKAGVILKTIATADGRAAYINIVGSSAVEGGMSASAAAPRGLDANIPFIVGDVRTDDDGQLGDGRGCYVVECMFHPSTMERFGSDKQAAETCIQTALAVVSKSALPVDQAAWSLFEPAALREMDGTYFFPPGKLAEGVE